MMAWWHKLTRRDQRILLYGGVFVAIVLLYTYAWMPVSQGVSAAYARVNAQKTSLIWMQHAVRRIDGYRKKGYVPTQAYSTALKTAVTNAIKAERLNVYLTSTQYAGTKTAPDSVTLNFNSVPFDRLVHMLQNLWLQDGVYVSQLSLSRTKTSGLIVAQFTLHKMG
jgi:type II secretory pathway component PulM